MADNYLITGYWGEPHVTAENDRGINAAIFGAGRFVLPVGEQFKAEYIGNNTIRMYDGKLMNNGAAAGIPVGEYVDLLIANAGQNMNRNDLIVFQYSQDASTLVESGTFVVIQGTETSGTAADPDLTQADLLSGEAVLDQMPMWRVSVSGTAISAPVKLFDVSYDMPGLEAWARGEFAPSGYGLGKAIPKVISDANNALDTGWYKLPAGSSNTPSGSYGVIYCVSYDDNHKFQTWYNNENSGRAAQRVMIGGTWQGWEWVNPPMILGTEYSTIEKWNGNTVYTKLYGMGNMPNNAAKTITVSNATTIVRCNVMRTDYLHLPYDKSGSIAKFHVSGKTIEIITNYNASSFSLIGQVWYIKD